MPQLRGRQRHVEVRDSERPERIDNRVRDRRHRSGATRFTHAFDAERTDFARRGMFFAAQALQQIRARHDVVHETRGERLARFAIVHDVFAKYLAGALHHAAVELAFNYRVIDDVTAVVDSAVRDDFRSAGLGIDLDFGNVAAIGKRRNKHAFSRYAQRPRPGELGELDAASGFDPTE